MNRLKGKRALITGGTSGIGLETAKQFINEGARVAITGRNPATLEAARNQLGQDVLIIPSDSSNVAAQRQVAEAVQLAFGGLDVLFVNAGIAELKPVEQWDEAAFDRLFAVNLKGPYFLIQALSQCSQTRLPSCSTHPSMPILVCQTRASMEPRRLPCCRWYALYRESCSRAASG